MKKPLRFYLFVLSLCFAGDAWLAYYKFSNQSLLPAQFSGCFLKTISGLPCPACGTSHAVLSILDGEYYQATLFNPLGWLAFAALLVFPLWIGIDLLLKKKSFLGFYIQSERILRRKPIAAVAVFLLLVNWVWNFYKL